LKFSDLERADGGRRQKWGKTSCDQLRFAATANTKSRVRAAIAFGHLPAQSHTMRGVEVKHVRDEQTRIPLNDSAFEAVDRTSSRLLEAGERDHEVESITRHLSRRTLEHYSHIRLNAKKAHSIA
jgi:hypothetical protein